MLRPFKVLIVDDDVTQLLVVKTWLERVGCEVLTRSTPFGTSGAILKSQPDVVLLDVEMPGLSGDLLADLISKQANRNPIGVIFYSGKKAETLGALAKQYQALGFIEKTEHPERFLQAFFSLTTPLRSKRP